MAQAHTSISNLFSVVLITNMVTLSGSLFFSTTFVSFPQKIKCCQIFLQMRSMLRDSFFWWNGKFFCFFSLCLLFLVLVSFEFHWSGSLIFLNSFIIQETYQSIEFICSFLFIIWNGFVPINPIVNFNCFQWWKMIVEVFTDWLWTNTSWGNEITFVSSESLWWIVVPQLEVFNETGHVDLTWCVLTQILSCSDSLWRTNFLTTDQTLLVSFATPFLLFSSHVFHFIVSGASVFHPFIETYSHSHATSLCWVVHLI